jgi:hypothetical protein
MRTLIAVLLLLAAAGQKGLALPTVAYSAFSSPGAPPLWVSTRVAFDENGDLRPELFEPAFRAILEKNRSANADGGCHTALGAPVGEVASSALTILAGDIVAADTGFYNGTPGTLFQLAVTDIVKSIGRYNDKGRLAQIFIANATITTPHGTICAREPFAATIPAVGDHVVVYSSVNPVDVEHRILPVDRFTRF